MSAAPRMMMPTSPTSSPDRRQQRLSGTFAAVLGSERRRSGSFSPSLQQKRRSVSGSSSRTQSPAPPLCFEDDDSDAAAAAAALPSELSERYDLGNLIGRGAYSAVWRAVERSTDRRVAIKAVSCVTSTPEQIEREVHNMQRLDHPNVLKLYAVCRTLHRVYIVMELAEGGTLFDVVSERGWLGDLEASAVVGKLLQALHHLHSRGVIHRDITPSNVLVSATTPTGSIADIRLADFGVSRALSASVAAASSFVGTSYYVAPEILCSDHHDAKVDCWSAGVVAFVLLTGALPFHSDDIRVLVSKICRGSYRWPSDVDVAPLAKDFVARMLTVDPDQRPTASEALGHPWIRRTSSGITLGSRRGRKK